MRLSRFLAVGVGAIALPVAVVATSCGDKVQSGLTGLDIQVTFESDLMIDVDKLRFAGFVGHTPAFPRDDRPSAGDSRELDPEDENLIVLLPDTMDGASVFVRVDALDGFGSILASSGAEQLVERDKILATRLHLGEKRICGDMMVHPSAEQCDDGNQLGEDGCSGECVIESGWVCEGEPSRCRTCGDGICSVGEDYCSCSEDCEGSMCGDGLCCSEKGEDVCNCAEDCLEEGDVTCPDGHCCAAEREAGNCMPDCGDCGDGECERDKGEDLCTCPADCVDVEASICGNQCCGVDETMSSCPQDCCPATPQVDGVCCPNESAETTPEDCCAGNALCGDSACCPGEQAGNCAECCPDPPVCGDGACCGGESPDSCAQDCCPSCSDSSLVCPGCCAEDCSSGECADCGPACSCEFDCVANGCDVNCFASSCHVQCGEKACNVNCEGGGGGRDGGPASGEETLPMGQCSCTGAGCNLTCGGGGLPIQCGDTNPPTYACGPAACP
jgi:hypothetical protein